MGFLSCLRRYSVLTVIDTVLSVMSAPPTAIKIDQSLVSESSSDGQWGLHQHPLSFVVSFLHFEQRLTKYRSYGHVASQMFKVTIMRPNAEQQLEGYLSVLLITGLGSQGV